MKKILLVVAVIIVFAVTPAYAQSGCEIAHECDSQPLDYILTSNAPLSTKYYTWNPLTQSGEAMYLYSLARLCQNYRGYYYMASDGAWYWFAC